MKKQTLPVDFKDDILDPSMNGKRRFNMIQNDDGTVSLEDVTAYSQIGSDFGQKQINETNRAVNESADKNRIIDDLDDIVANTQPGMMAGALAVRELNGDKIDSYKFGPTLPAVKTGEYLNSAPVYIKMVDAGALPNNTTKNVATGISDADYIWIDLSNSLVFKGGASYPLLYTDPANLKNAIACRLTGGGATLAIQTGTSWDGYTALVAVKFTKK